MQGPLPRRRQQARPVRDLQVQQEADGDQPPEGVQRDHGEVRCRTEGGVARGCQDEVRTCSALFSVCPLLTSQGQGAEAVVRDRAGVHAAGPGEEKQKRQRCQGGIPKSF